MATNASIKPHTALPFPGQIPRFPAGRFRSSHKGLSKSGSGYLFSDSALFSLLLPIIIEQFLNSFMGMADTMMISNLGSTALSAVSLTDAINTLVVQVFAALAAGGTVICSQYLGQHNIRRSNSAARQLILVIFILSISVTTFCYVLRRPLLALIFGDVPAEVMEASLIYFQITVLSYPFFALLQGGSALYRACGASGLPMRISIITNLMNIAGNALLIFVIPMGITGAALATLISRVIGAAWILTALHKGEHEIVIRHYLTIRPNPSMIRKVMFLSIPSGIENGMFQFGKLAIQSSISTLGTTAIAAQAMAAIFENLNGIVGIGIGIGLMTVVAQCLGAEKKAQAVYYIKKLSIWAEIGILLSCSMTYIFADPILKIAGMESDAYFLCMRMILIISICKPILWVPSFIPPYGFRAAGDVRFTMLTSSLTMWIFRVAGTIFMIRVLHLGILSVWLGMFTDWFVRGLIFTFHFIKGRWMDTSIL